MLLCRTNVSPEYSFHKYRLYNITFYKLSFQAASSSGINPTRKTDTGYNTSTDILVQPTSAFSQRFLDGKKERKGERKKGRKKGRKGERKKERVTPRVKEDKFIFI